MRKIYLSLFAIGVLLISMIGCNTGTEETSTTTTTVVAEISSEQITDYMTNAAVGKHGLYITDANPDVTVIGSAIKSREDVTVQLSLEKCSNLKSIAAKSFEGCKNLTFIRFPKGLTAIGESAFSGCENMTGINLPNTVRSIGKKAFEDCGKNVGEKSSLYNSSSYSDGAFIVNFMGNIEEYCNIEFGYDWSARFYFYLNAKMITDLTIPAGVKELPSYSFYNCHSIKSVVFSQGITKIGDNVFDGWGISLSEDIILPSSITEIGYNAFTKAHFKNMTVRAAIPPTLGNSAIPNTCTKIYVPTDYVERYVNASGWINYSSRIFSMSVQ